MNVCSQYTDEDWLDYAAERIPAEKSRTMEKHLNSCEDCRRQLLEMDGLRELSSRYDSVDLPPFPKGDESDLFSKARDESERIREEDPPDREMDPDLKQVLSLFPEVFLLILLVVFLPLLVTWFGGSDSNRDRDGQQPDGEKQEQRRPGGENGHREQPDESSDQSGEAPGKEQEQDADEDQRQRNGDEEKKKSNENEE